MSVACPICSAKVFENTDCFECKKCEKWVHKKCTGLSNEIYLKTAKLIKKEGLKWFCKACEKSEVRSENLMSTNSRKDYTLADIMEKLENMELKQSDLLQMYNNQQQINQQLQEEIKLLKQKVQELSNTDPVTRGNNQTDAIRELSERESKKNNLMIFGCEETNSNDESELKNIQDIIKSVCPEIKMDGLKIRRVGIRNANKTRPLKVTLHSHSEVRNVFFRAKDLVKIPEYRHLALGFDKTARQIAEYKSLKDEMQKRMDNGEKNLRIKYFRDIPRIIKISDEPKNYRA